MSNEEQNKPANYHYATASSNVHGKVADVYDANNNLVINATISDDGLAEMVIAHYQQEMESKKLCILLDAAAAKTLADMFQQVADSARKFNQQRGNG